MATRLSNAARSAACDAVVDMLDGGEDPGYIEIRTGTQPAGPDTTSDLGTLLVTIELDDPAYGAASNGVAALAETPRTGTGVAAGTAGWFRAYHGDTSSGGAGVFDGRVRADADPDNGEELVLDNTVIAIGQTVNINTLTHTQPAGA